MADWHLRILQKTWSFALVFLVTPAFADDSIIIDWTVVDYADTVADITPAPHFGNCNLCRSDFLATYAQAEAMGKPVAVMMRDVTAPVNGSKTPGALADLMTPADGGVNRLDYVFADYESSTDDQDVLDTVSLVRNNPNPAYNQARIGNYWDYPVTNDPTLPYADQHDRSSDAAFYLSSGLDVAQPVLYPYEYFVNHYNRPDQHSTLSPNKRSALFWAPLERVSLTKKVLPAGHLLVPWTGGFISYDGFSADPPEKVDLEALIQHIRLRGSDGYATFRSKFYASDDNGSLGSWIDSYTDEDYRVDSRIAWDDLDDIYAVPGETTILNLETDKVAGVEWSGIQRGNQVEILISNLGSSAVTLDLPSIAGLPDFAPSVAAGSHQRFRFTAILPGDFNADGNIDGDDIDALAAAAGSTDLAFDLNGDNMVTFAASGSGVSSDSDYLIRTILGTEYGDANLDGEIDVVDFDLLGQGFQEGGSGWLFGDFSGSGGVTDIVDFDLLGQYYGFSSTPSASTAIPEPSAVCLCCLGLLCCAYDRHVGRPRGFSA